MSGLLVLTAAQQVAAHLRGELVRGVWSGLMPGGDRLAAELGVGRDTAEAALRELEGEGWLVNQGRRRGRLIVLPEDHAPPGLRVAILAYEKGDKSLDYLIDCMNRLEAAGHSVSYAPGNLTEMKMDVRRIARMVGKTEADAWVVAGGTGEVLEWFLKQKSPAFALYGRRRKLKIAGIGPNVIPAVAEATRRLVDLGHQRIVFLDSLYHISEPGIVGTAFLDELTAHGIAVSSYNMPGWQGGAEGLYALLDSSFRTTPPTAIIVGSGPTYFATLHFLLNRGIRVPQDLSLVVQNDDPFFSQCRPSVAHIRWSSSRPVADRIVEWIRNISQGKEDTRQTTIKAKFFEGGTIGPAPTGVR